MEIKQAQFKNILAMTIFGTMSIFVRNIHLHSLEIAFWRGVVAFGVLGLIKLCSKEKTICTISWKQKLLLLVSGMAIGLNWAFFFMAYEYTSVAVATLTYYFAPVLVIILSPILFKETPSPFQIVCFGMATLGLVFVIGTDGGAAIQDFKGIAYGLCAAVLYAGVILMNKFLHEGTSLDRTLIQFIGASVLLLAILPRYGGIQIVNADVSTIGNLMILGIVYTGFCYWLYFASISQLSGQQTAILSYVDPFTAILVSVIFFQEPLKLAQGVGAALILGFTALHEISKNFQESTKKKTDKKAGDEFA